MYTGHAQRTDHEFEVSTVPPSTQPDKKNMSLFVIFHLHKSVGVDLQLVTVFNSTYSTVYTPTPFLLPQSGGDVSLWHNLEDGHRHQAAVHSTDLIIAKS